MTSSDPSTLIKEAKQAEHAVVKERFNSHLVRKHNIIFEWAKFNIHKHNEGKSIDGFMTDLYALADHCSYEVVHGES